MERKSPPHLTEGIAQVVEDLSNPSKSPFEIRPEGAVVIGDGCGIFLCNVPASGETTPVRGDRAMYAAYNLDGVRRPCYRDASV